jgi:YD repeat-containing protein
LKSNNLAALGVDSIVTLVNFDAGNNRYKNGISAFVLLGQSIRDSIAFQYDGTGRLASETDYTDAGFGMTPATKTDYGYVGSNLAGEKVYAYDNSSSSFQLEDTYTYEYDSKINPLQFATEGAILNMNPFYSANNITKTTLVASDPADNFVSIETYTYNASGRPASSTTVTGTETSTTTYYYQ